MYRFLYNFNLDTLTNPLPLLSWYHLAEHSGGRLIFGVDKKLYASTAEYFKADDSLFYNSGKILRLNFDGTVPADNPKADYTWTWGHRNPQGLTTTSKGKIFSSEFGHNNDELNLIQKNFNYGWIIWDGSYCLQPQDTCDFYFPICKHPLDIGENPPSGIDYYQHDAIPELNGIIEAVPGSRGSQGIIAYGLNSTHDGVLSKNRYLISKNNSYLSSFQRIRDVCTAPNGEVYFIGFDRAPNAAIFKIKNPDFCYMQSNLVSNTNNDGLGSLRRAIACANFGDTIFFDPSIANDTIRLIKSPILINKKIFLNSQGLINFKIISESLSATPMFYINKTGELHLQNLSLISKVVNSPGNIIINYGKLELKDLIIKDLVSGQGVTVYNGDSAEIKVNSNIVIIKN